MSTIDDLIDPASTEREVREQLDAVTEPHETSAQAHGDVGGARHNDGERIYKDFSIPPFHKFLAKSERHEQNVALYPSAWLGTLLHLEEREKELIEHIAGDVDYHPDDPHVEHDVLQQIAESEPLRAKTLEWVAADGGDRLPWNASGNRTIDTFTAGGTDTAIYGAPGSGKTTLALFHALTRMQLNNETVIWADTLDDSYQNERCEWLSMAPYATVAVPAHLDVSVRIVPKNPSVSPFEVDLEDIARDVVRYSGPRDLVSGLTRGQFYVVFPDPTFKNCEAVSQFPYHAPGDTTPVGEDGPSEPTPPDHWWFAFMSARVTHDLYGHWTTLLLDEAGNLLDPDASKDVHKTYQKIEWWMEKFADARKKGVTVDTMCHAVAERHRKIRAKERRWLTMNGTSPPIGKSMPGDKTCPMYEDYVSDMDAGQGQIWTTQNYASISWPNLKRDARVDAEVSIEFDLPGGVA